MPSFLAVLLTLLTLFQGWVAYQLCFTVTPIGGYLYFAILTLPCLAAAFAIHNIARRERVI